MVLHHLREALGAGLDSRVGDEQHLHQLGDQVGVPDVVLTTDENHQEGDDFLHTRLIQDLGGIPGGQEEEGGMNTGLLVDTFIQSTLRYQGVQTFLSIGGPSGIKPLNLAVLELCSTH